MLGSRGGIGRAGLSSAFATLSDFALVFMLVSGLGISAPIATLVGCAFGAVVNFTVNRRWAFGSDAPTGSQALRYAFVSATSALWNAALVALLLLIPLAPYTVVWWIARAAVFAGWNYPLYRAWVFVRSGSA
jgi:putative flippase GtrA